MKKIRFYIFKEKKKTECLSRFWLSGLNSVKNKKKNLKPVVNASTIYENMPVCWNCTRNFHSELIKHECLLKLLTLNIFI